RWDRELIGEGEALLTRALAAGRPGPYQLHAAIAACHSCPEEADWPQIAALYGELARYEPTPVTEANRAVAVAMAGQPAAGRAVQVAAISPSTADSSRKITRLDTGTTVSVMPCWRSEATRARPSAVPMTIPTMAPKMARITASDLTIARTWRRRMPTARS